MALARIIPHVIVGNINADTSIPALLGAFAAECSLGFELGPYGELNETITVYAIHPSEPDFTIVSLPTALRLSLFGGCIKTAGGLHAVGKIGYSAGTFAFSSSNQCSMRLM